MKANSGPSGAAAAGEVMSTPRTTARMGARRGAGMARSSGNCHTIPHGLVPTRRHGATVSAVKATAVGRWTREDWVELAVARLKADGAGALTLEALCLAAGRTKGSFYHH